MIRLQPRFLLAGLALFSLWPASAFVRVRHPENGRPLVRTDAAGITFRINARTAPGLANSGGQSILTPSSDPLAALRAAMDSWTAVPTSSVTFLSPGATNDDNPSVNGEHIITFVDTPANRAIAGDAIVVTVATFNFAGEITDTDIVFNPTRTFSTNNQSNTFDLQSVAAHELGHALGAGHSGLLAATMFHALPPNSAIAARLTSDDAAFATSVYPEAGALSSLGSISGTVRNLPGVPVFGALMVAVGVNSGVAVGSISDRDGTYTIPALPPGDYFVYAEPADGPVTVSQLPSYYLGASTGFRTAFAGGSELRLTLTALPGQRTPLDLVLLEDPPNFNIDFAATTPVGGTDLSNATQGPLQVRAGDTFDFIVAGRGLDDQNIRETDVLLVGAGLTIRPGSLQRTDVINGRPSLRITVQIAATAVEGTGTLILKGAAEGTAYTAVLKILSAAGTGGPGPGVPVLLVTPDTLEFTAPAGAQTIVVDGTFGLAWTAGATTDSGGNWLIIGPSSGTVPGSISVLAVAGNLPPGAYTGRVTVSAPGTTSRVVAVIFIIPPPPPPVVLAGGVVNAASFVGGGIVPGEIISILGSLLGPDVGITASPDSDGRLPRSLGEVVVHIGGIPAPLFFVRHDQINAQVPYELAGQASTDLYVEYRGQTGQRVALRVLEAKPGVFTVGPGAGQAAALNQDSSPNSAGNPAAIGSVVQLFLTGQGVVSPQAVTGQRAPSSAPFPAPQRPVRVSIGGVEAVVAFAGLAPGAIGVLQINVVVPSGFFPRENVPVIVTIGSAQGPTNVTIAVR